MPIDPNLARGFTPQISPPWELEEARSRNALMRADAQAAPKLLEQRQRLNEQAIAGNDLQMGQAQQSQALGQQAILGRAMEWLSQQQDTQGALTYLVPRLQQAGVIDEQDMQVFAGMDRQKAAQLAQAIQSYSAPPIDPTAKFQAQQRVALENLKSGNDLEIEKVKARERAALQQQGQSFTAQQGALDRQSRMDLKQQEIDRKVAEKEAKASARARDNAATAQNVISEVDRALGMVDWSTAGVIGLAASNIGSTDAYDLSASLETIRANLGFDRLQRMREASPTGGALGQVAVQELNALQNSVASLKQGQKPSVLAANLIRVRNHYENWKRIMSEASGQSGATGGWTVEEVQ